MKTRTVKLFIDDYGSFLGRAEGALTVLHSDRTVEKYPLFDNEVGEIQISMGNSVSVVALATAAMWGIDTVILTQRGNPVAYLKSLEDDSHVRTRVCQYEALKNGKGMEIARQIVLAKIAGQNRVLIKRGLRQHDMVRIKKKIAEANSKNALLTIEGHTAENYFSQIFKLLPKSMRIQRRRTFKAFDATNNVFNLCYSLLRWKVHRALIRAKLEPYLGFLHSEQFSKPSLVCDLMELYRSMIDDFLIDYCKKLRKKDFIRQHQEYSANKKGQREFLRKDVAKDMTSKLNSYFEKTVELPRIKHGNRQTIETLINEEALLLARHLRSEKGSWVPRVANIW